VWKISPLSSSSRNRELNDSQYPFSQGDPGSMKAVLAPTAMIQLLTFSAMNSGP